MRSKVYERVYLLIQSALLRRDVQEIEKISPWLSLLNYYYGADTEAGLRQVNKYKASTGWTNKIYKEYHLKVCQRRENYF
jgi:hypothetical protein